MCCYPLTQAMNGKIKSLCTVLPNKLLPCGTCPSCSVCSCQHPNHLIHGFQPVLCPKLLKADLFDYDQLPCGACPDKERSAKGACSYCPQNLIAACSGLDCMCSKQCMSMLADALRRPACQGLSSLLL